MTYVIRSKTNSGIIKEEKHSRLAAGRHAERSERRSHAGVRIVELLKGWSRRVAVERRRGIAQHVHVRSRWRMMRWRIMRGIRTDHRGRDQRFAGTRRFHATGTGTATTYNTNVNQPGYFLSTLLLSPCTLISSQYESTPTCRRGGDRFRDRCRRLFAFLHLLGRGGARVAAGAASRRRRWYLLLHLTAQRYRGRA